MKETKEEKAIKNYFKKRNRIILCVSTAVLLILLIDGLFFTKKNKENKNNSNIEEVVNNSEKEDKEIDNKDNNKEEKEEVSSKPSRINLRLIIFIFVIIIIAVIIFFTIIKLIIKNKKKFKFDGESRKDFAKENFCPIFFIISKYEMKNLLKREEFNGIEIEQTGECFFEILAKLIFSEFKEKEEEEIKKIKILINDTYNNKESEIIDNTLVINFMNIVSKINSFTFCNTNDEDRKQFFQSRAEIFPKEAELYGKYEEENKKIKEKYSNYIEFCSYLYSYLIYYLFGIFNKNGDKTLITVFKETKDPVTINGTDYNQVDFNIMTQILNRLIFYEF